MRSLFFRLAIWWLLVRWSGEAIWNSGRGSPFIEVWLVASAFLLSAEQQGFSC